MQFIVESTKELWAKKAADIVEEAIKGSEKPVLVLPTGGTPVPMYEELVKRYNAGTLSFKNMVSFNLDEYVGMDYEHPESYHGFMKRNLFAHVDALPENVHVPEGLAADPEQAAREYNEGLDNCGGIDLAVLGIGPGLTFDGGMPNCFLKALLNTYIDVKPSFSETCDTLSSLSIRYAAFMRLSFR